MKHTLKSLLITTVLTLPTTFAAHDSLLENANETPKPLSFVEAIRNADAFKSANNVEAAVNTYADYAKRPDVEWFQVLWAAQRIEELGFYEKATQLFLWSKTAQNTRKFFSQASNEINRLRNLYSSQVNAIMLKADNIKKMGSDYYPEAATVYEQVAAHADASVDDGLNAAKNIQNLGEAYYQRAAALYCNVLKRKDASVKDIRKAVFGFREMGIYYYPEIAILYEQIVKHGDASVEDIKKTAVGNTVIGKLYLKAESLNAEAEAEADAATDGKGADEIRESEYNYKMLGYNRLGRAAELYELVIVREDASIEAIFEAAGGLRELELIYTIDNEGSIDQMGACAVSFLNQGNELRYRATELHAEADAEPEGNGVEIRKAALNYNERGCYLLERAAALFEKIAEHADVDVREIVDAAHYLSDLGYDCYQLAEADAEIEGKGVDRIRELALENNALGGDFLKRAAALYKKAAEHHNEIRLYAMAECAKYFGKHGRDLLQKATEWSAKADGTPEGKSVDDILRAVKENEQLKFDFYQRVVASYDQLVAEGDVTRRDIDTAATALKAKRLILLLNNRLYLQIAPHRRVI